MHCPQLLLLLITASILPQLKPDHLALPHPATGGRIIGGGIAKEGQFPYQVFIRTDKSATIMQTCGGSIITPKLILTAAHCVYDQDGKFEKKDPSLFKICAGRLISNCPLSEFRHVKRVHYTAYELVNKTDDLAMLELTAALPLSNLIQPVALNNKTRPANSTCVVSGWGTYGNESHDIEPKARHVSPVLRFTEMHLLNLPECGEYLKVVNLRISLLGPGQVCVTDYGHTTSSCSGDSGGPYVCDGVQVGLVSYHLGKCVDREEKQPIISVYTDIQFYLDWILKNAGDEARHIEIDPPRQAADVHWVPFGALFCSMLAAFVLK